MAERVATVTSVDDGLEAVGVLGARGQAPDGDAAGVGGAHAGGPKVGGQGRPGVQLRTRENSIALQTG